MKGERGVTRSIIQVLHSKDIQLNEMKKKSSVTRSIIDEFHSSDIQRDEIEV